MTDNDWAKQLGITGIALSVAFYAYYLPNMAPDRRHVRHGFKAAGASLAGVWKGTPNPDGARGPFLEPVTFRRSFVQASLVPEARVVNGEGDEEDAASPVDESSFEMENQIPTPSLSLLSQMPAGNVRQSAAMATIEEFLALDEEAFEMDEVDLTIPELSEDTGHGASFTFRTHKARRGETIRRIAAIYQVNTDQLEVVNARKADRPLAVGDEIIVPAGLGMFHQVTKKDSIWTVARRYNLKPATILFFNRGKQDEIRLVENEKIFIPLGAIDLKDARLIAANKAIRSILENKLAFCWPLQGRLSSRFGWRVHPIFHRGRMHKGIDIAVPRGTPIRAAERGRVVWAGWRGGAGLCVILEHPNGMYTIYAHCSKILTKRGSWVSRRQIISRVGDTGLSTGPHLHFAMKRDGEVVNPLKCLPAASF